MDRKYDSRQAEDQEWARIAAVFLAQPARPTTAETEAFVAKFMGRIRPEQAPVPEAVSPWPWALWRWASPAMGFALAASLALLLQPGAEAGDPAELLLTGGEAASPIQAASQLREPTTDDMLALAMEKL